MNDVEDAVSMHDENAHVNCLPSNLLDYFVKLYCTCCKFSSVAY